MSIFGKILKTGFDVVTTPIDIVKDVVTLGGSITGEDEPHTLTKLKKLGKDLEETREEIDRL